MKVEQVLEVALEKRASDIHFTSNSPIYIRIDNDLAPLFPEKCFSVQELLEILACLVSQEQFNRFSNKECFDIDFSFERQNLRYRFRGNAFYFAEGIGISLRTITLDPPTLDSLMVPPAVRSISKLTDGLVLVSGPTGSGKSTTLAAIIGEINEHYQKHIITLEDPIEYIYPSKGCLIHQRQVMRDTANFNDSLRAALREDPDCILVGELRDLETIRLALTAAETGHLVLATLHTNSAAESIDRMVDVFHAGEKELIRSMLANTLRMVVAQRLLKKKTGGRVAAMEVMICSLAVKNLIRENKIFQIHSAMQMGKALGMQTMSDSVKQLITKRIVDEELYRPLTLLV